MVEHQESTKNMENLNIIIEINEDGEMANFDIALRNTELPYKNTDEFEYVVEEFEKVKEVNHKKFRCLLARELNCFACTAIYRFQLIFVRRKRKVPVVEYVPGIRNTIVTSTPVPIVRQTQQYQQPQQTMVKVVSPKMVGLPVVKNNVKTFPVRNTVSVQQTQPQQTHRVVIAQQQPIQVQMKKEEDASRLRQMLEKRQLQQKGLSGSPAAKRFAVAAKNQQNLAQRIIHAQPTTVVTAPDVGSSEEDIETEVIDSSMVEVEMKSNSNSPLPGAVKQNKTSSKVVVRREPNVSVMEEAKSPTPSDANPLKCDLCNKEFHSLRQRERHRVTHTKDSVTTTSTRLKSISIEEPAASPNNMSKQSPKTTTTPTNTGKRTSGVTSKRGKTTQTPEPMEEAVIEVTTAGEDSEN